MRNTCLGIQFVLIFNFSKQKEWDLKKMRFLSLKIQKLTRIEERKWKVKEDEKMRWLGHQGTRFVDERKSQVFWVLTFVILIIRNDRTKRKEKKRKEMQSVAWKTFKATKNTTHYCPQNININFRFSHWVECDWSAGKLKKRKWENDHFPLRSIFWYLNAGRRYPLNTYK